MWGSERGTDYDRKDFFSKDSKIGKRLRRGKGAGWR